MTTHLAILFLHFVGMAAMFIGYGLEWAASAFLPGATTGDQGRAWLRVYKGSLPVSGPGLLLLILTGGYLAGTTGQSKEGWTIATYLGIALALVIGFAMILPRMKTIRAALPEGNAAIAGAALGHVQDPVIPTLVRIRTLLALGIVYLMTAKPALVPSFVVLLAAIGLGVILAAPAWTRRRT